MNVYSHVVVFHGQFFVSLDALPEIIISTFVENG